MIKTKRFKIAVFMLMLVCLMLLIIWTTTQVQAAIDDYGYLIGYTEAPASIGVYVKNGSSDRYNADNVQWTHDGTNWTSENIVLYEENSQQEIYGYYPYREDNGEILISMPEAFDVDNFEDYDYLYADSTSIEEGLVSITMGHLFAKLEVRLIPGTELDYDEFDVASVRIEEMYSDGIWNPENCTWTHNSSRDASIQMYEEDVGTYMAYVIPICGCNDSAVDVCESFPIVVTMENGREFKTNIEVPDSVLEAGNQYNISLQVGQDKVELGEITASPWGNHRDGGGLETNAIALNSLTQDDGSSENTEEIATFGLMYDGAGITSFMSDSKIAISDGIDTAIYQSYERDDYILWTTDDPLLWNDTEETTFTAWFPESDGTNYTSFTLPTNQSGDLSSADWMTDSYTGNCSSEPLNISFQHNLSKVTIMTNLATQYDGDEPITDVKIYSMGKNITANYDEDGNSTVSATKELTAITPLTDSDYNTYTAIVAPGVYSADDRIMTLIVNGVDAYEVLANDEIFTGDPDGNGVYGLEPGTSYSFYLMIGEDLESIIITFDLNGNEGTVPDDIEIFPGEETYLPELTSTSCKTFIGWSTSKTSTIANYYANTPVSFDEDITLYAVFEETHSFEDGKCTLCGVAMEINVSFDAINYEWETGDQIRLARWTGDFLDDYYFTVEGAEDSMVTWTPDKTLYWNGTDKHTLAVSYPNMNLIYDNFGIPGDQSTLEKLREADCMNAIWTGNPTTDLINFNLKHRLAKVTVNYEVAEGVTVSKAEIYTFTQYMFFDIDTLERRNVAWEEGDDFWINSYLDDNQFTAFVSPDAYAKDSDFIKITLDDGTVLEIKMNNAVTFAEGGKYNYNVIITADSAYIISE